MIIFKYFWPVFSFGMMIRLSFEEPSLFFVTFCILIAYLFHKGSERGGAC